MTPMPKEWEADQTWIGVHTKTMNIAIGVIYLRPMGLYCEKQELLEKLQAINVRVLELQNKNFKVLLMGDFNAKIIKTQKGIQGDNEAGFGLIDLAVLANLSILNYDPITKGKFTWIPEGKRGNQESSTLDYVLHDTKSI